MFDKSCRNGLVEWFTGPLGCEVWEAERAELSRILPNLFGYHILQLGSTGAQLLLSDSRILHRVIVDPEAAEAGLRAEPSALPLVTDSVDVILLPHTLEFGGDPRDILREADRSLIPEGHLVVLGFNPWSLWGLRRLLRTRRGSAPWCGRFLSITRLKDWLRLLGFDTVYVKTFFFRPPLNRAGILERLRRLELTASRHPILPAGVYVLLAKKRVVALTPIRPRWRPRRRMVAAGVTEPTARQR